MPNLSDLYKPVSVWLSKDASLSPAQARMFVWREVLGDLLDDVTDACDRRLPDQACDNIDETIRVVLDRVGKQLKTQV